MIRSIALALGACLWVGAASAVTIDGVAAIVGNQVILRSQLDFQTRLMLMRVQSQGGQLEPSQVRELRLRALRNLIDDQLIMLLAERNEAVATDAEIDDAIQRIAEDEGVTPEDIYAAARAQGLGEAGYRDQLRREMTRMRVVGGSVRNRITVTDEEVRELYEQRYVKVAPGERIRVLHILIPTPPDLSESDQQRADEFANQVREQALETGDFAGLARRVSAAPSAQTGGLTVFREGDAPPVIAAALERMAPGEISQVIRTDHGLNLFQFLDRFDPSSIQYEEIEPQLRAELVEERTGPEFQEFLDDIRKRHYIEIVNTEPM